MDYNSGIYTTNGGEELHIGGKVVVDEGADLSALSAALAGLGRFGVCDLSQSFGVAYSDMVSGDTAVTYGGIVKGYIKYVEGNDKFGEDEQNGYFFPFHLGDEFKGRTITVKRTSGEGGTERSAAEQDWVLRLTDGPGTIYEIKDGETLITKLSFGEAEFAPIPISKRARQSKPEDEDELYGESLESLVRDTLVVYADGSVEGTLKYIDNYGPGAMPEEVQSGYFAPIHFDGVEGKKLAVRRTSGTPGQDYTTSKLDSVVFRLQDLAETVYDVRLDGKHFMTLTFRDIRFVGEPGVTGKVTDDE